MADSNTREVEKEQERANEVKKKAAMLSGKLSRQTGLAGDEISQLQKNFWEDVTVNYEDIYEAAETEASIRQQSELLAEQVRRRDHTKEQIKLLSKLQKSPYFGRIDFREEGEEAADEIYIGMGSFYDEEKDQFLVYDWRAPIASVYYDYPAGPAEYSAPFAIIKGELLLKRQFVFREGEIVSMFDTSLTIGDELLREVLGKQANTQMKNIAATIQREQNAVIRNTSSSLLVVQGAAGSGKTSAALQRVAFLLYRFRNRLSSDQVLLFSPNSLFSSYTANVLPELGEKSMKQSTFQQFIEERLGDSLTAEDLFTQTEYVLSKAGTEGYEARMAGIRYKSSVGFMDRIDRLLSSLRNHGLAFKPIRFRGRELISSEEISQVFYSLDSHLTLTQKTAAAAEKLQKALKAHEAAERKAEWVEEEMQYLDKEEYLKSFRYADKQESDFGGTEREFRYLAKKIAAKAFRPLYRQIRKFDFIDTQELYCRLFDRSADEEEEWQDICSLTKQRLENGQILYEDAAPYLYLKGSLQGFPGSHSVEYLFIDEAQDYSPFQFALLRRQFPNCKMTVLGDLNQAIYVQGGELGIEWLKKSFEKERTEVIKLSRSYRSTREITEFAQSILKKNGQAEAFNRKGKKPVIAAADKEHTEDTLARLLQRILENGCRTAAVITRTAEESERLYKKLKEKLDVSLVLPGNTHYQDGAVILPIFLAKGIEFDAVIVRMDEENMNGSAAERRLFYTACTRAMHELYVLAAEGSLPFIEELDQSLYIKEEYK